MPTSCHCTTAGADTADGGARREGGKSALGGGGRCHCVGGVNSYGIQTLSKEENWGEIQVQGTSRKVASGERKTEGPQKGRVVLADNQDKQKPGWLAR